MQTFYEVTKRVLLSHAEYYIELGDILAYDEANASTLTVYRAGDIKKVTTTSPGSIRAMLKSGMITEVEAGEKVSPEKLSSEKADEVAEHQPAQSEHVPEQAPQDATETRQQPDFSLFQHQEPEPSSDESSQDDGANYTTVMDHSVDISQLTKRELVKFAADNHGLTLDPSESKASLLEKLAHANASGANAQGA